MRIIAGKYKGRRITAPKGLPVRPTTDFAKEGLFNYLNNRVDIENKTVIDLFAGTGNMSFEFISRGASPVYAVDIHHKCVRYMIRVSKELKFENFKVLRNDALKFLKRCTVQADIIFLDPPYASPLYTELIETILERDLLLPRGLCIVEHDKNNNFDAVPLFKESKKYGNVIFSVFEKP